MLLEVLQQFNGLRRSNRQALRKVNVMSQRDDQNNRRSRPLTRRRFLGAAATALAVNVLASRACDAEPSPAVKSKPDVIIHRGGYPGWPWVARARNGHLVCVFRDDGIHGFSPTGKVLWTESRDEGKTWAAARVVAEEEGVDDRNAAVVELPGGPLLVCYNTYTKNEVSRPMVTWSKDDGATWTGPAMIAPIDARTRRADRPCLRRDRDSDLQGPRKRIPRCAIGRRREDLGAFFGA